MIVKMTFFQRVYFYFFEAVSGDEEMVILGFATPGGIAVLEAEVVVRLLSTAFLVGGLGLTGGTAFFRASPGDERDDVENELISSSRSESNPDIPGMTEQGGSVLDRELILPPDFGAMQSARPAELEPFRTMPLAGR